MLEINDVIKFLCLLGKYIHKVRFLQFIPHETLFSVELKTFYDSVCKEPENTKRSSSVKHVVETYRQNNAAAAILILFI